MDTMTKTQADRIQASTARIVANMRTEADELAAAGRHEDAARLHRFADSRERAGMRAKAGAKIGRA